MVLPRADIAGTRPAATVEPPTPIAAGTSARQETVNRLAQIMLGRQLQAEVLSRFNDGTFLVSVADTPARMSLPDGTKVGDNLSMTMLAHEPRPTFLLNGEPGSATATLSPAARLIDTILQLAQRNGTDTAINAKEALLPSSMALATEGTTPQIAEALHDTLTYSGLFYESHLQEWLGGSRTSAELMREPQAKMQSAGEPAQQFASSTNALSSSPDLDTRLTDLLRNAQLITTNPAITDADTMLPPSSRSDIVTADSMQLLPLQLHALEQQQIIWHGELFPGQPMEWSVKDDTPRGKDRNVDEPKQWQSAVRFELPSLGAISAAIMMTGDRVQIQVHTASEDSAATLRAHGQELAEALAAAGSPLDALLIKQDEQA